MILAVKDLSIGHYGYSGGVRCFIDGADSAGGISIKGSIISNSKRPVEYITLYFKPYDESGDSVGCSVRRSAKQTIDVSGPFYPGIPVDFFFENMWYNYSICSCGVIGADIVYEDGETENISASLITTE